MAVTENGDPSHAQDFKCVIRDGCTLTRIRRRDTEEVVPTAWPRRGLASRQLQGQAVGCRGRSNHGQLAGTRGGYLLRSHIRIQRPYHANHAWILQHPLDVLHSLDRFRKAVSTRRLECFGSPSQSIRQHAQTSSTHCA